MENQNSEIKVGQFELDVCAKIDSELKAREARQLESNTLKKSLAETKAEIEQIGVDIAKLVEKADGIMLRGGSLKRNDAKILELQNRKDVLVSRVARLSGSDGLISSAAERLEKAEMAVRNSILSALEEPKGKITESINEKFIAAMDLYDGWQKMCSSLFENLEVSHLLRYGHSAMSPTPYEGRLSKLYEKGFFKNPNRYTTPEPKAFEPETVEVDTTEKPKPETILSGEPDSDATPGSDAAERRLAEFRAEEKGLIPQPIEPEPEPGESDDEPIEPQPGGYDDDYFSEGGLPEELEVGLDESGAA